LLLAFVGVAFCLWQSAHATVIATDFDLPASMDAGGTDVDPAEYVFGNAFGISGESWGSDIFLGETESWNELLIQNNSEFDIGGLNSSSYIGYDNQSDNNNLGVDGSDLELRVTTYVGYHGSNNSLTLRAGSRMLLYNASDIFYIGYGFQGTEEWGSNNTVTVTGSGTSVATVSSKEIYVGYQGSNNIFSILDGATMTTGDLAELFVGGVGGSSNQLIVDGSVSFCGLKCTTRLRVKVHHAFVLPRGRMRSTPSVSKKA
jgi:hypothetical protein